MLNKAANMLSGTFDLIGSVPIPGIVKPESEVRVKVSPRKGSEYPIMLTD